MRAAVFQRYGGPEVVQVREVPRPEPRRGEVLVRVHAAAVTSGDARIRAARFPGGFALFARLAFGVVRPRRRVLGGSLSGVVEAVGSEATTFAPGDAVCGMTGVRLGAHAEHAAVPAARLVRVPAGVSHDDAAAVLFGGTTALHFLRRKGKVGAGDTVLVNGATGAIGTNAIQLAHHAGATVTAVCSTVNAGLVRELGADHVIDYRATPVAGLTERYDLVLDAVGNLDIATGRRLLVERGRLLLPVATLWQMVRARRNVVVGSSGELPEDFSLLLAMVADGTLRVVHDQAFDLADIAAAYRVVDSGHKVGNVVVRP